LPAVFSNIGSIPVSRPTPEERQSDLDNALSWIRQGKPDDHDMSEKFKKIDALLPTKKFQSPEERAKALEGALDGMRNHGVKPISDTPIHDFESLGKNSVLHHLG
jgi:hypothetical protein